MRSFCSRAKSSGSDWSRLPVRLSTSRVSARSKTSGGTTSSPHDRSRRCAPASLPEHLNEGPMIYTMDKFVVNLSGQPRRTIRVQVNLDMLSALSFEEIMDSENRAKARDRIVRLLNEKTFTDLESIQGKLFLKDKIVEEVNKVLKVGLVKDVYFTDFVMN